MTHRQFENAVNKIMEILINDHFVSIKITFPNTDMAYKFEDHVFDKRGTIKHVQNDKFYSFTISAFDIRSFDYIFNLVGWMISEAYDFGATKIKGI